MPVPSEMVGATIGPVTHDVDARWTMAYAAALGDTHDCYFDTRRPEGVVAHPLFPVCPEWPVIVESRRLGDQWGITPDETRRGVHASHDLTIHRSVRPGDTLTTTLTCIGVEAKRPGAFSTLELTTVDAAGEPVATTRQGSMYLGVAVTGHDRPPPPSALPTWPTSHAAAWEHELVIPIAHGAAHTYTESARIWNPIHTDAAVAEAAGLPAIILHGTATLALAVSAVVDRVAGGRPDRVRRIIGRFGAMVLMPSDISVRISEPSALDTWPDPGTTAVTFEVRTAADGPAVDHGVILLGP